MGNSARTKGVLFLFISTLLACSGSTTSYPDLSTFKTSPSDQFIIAAADLTKISVAAPFRGSTTACAHKGAHIGFTDTGSPYTVNVYAPASGTVTRVDQCYYGSPNDRYGLNIGFAKYGGETVSFEYSIEPMGGQLCSSGVSGQDNGAFHSYILVTLGQKVTKGDIVAKMYKPTTGSDGSHIHFNLSRPSGTTFYCPNIFNSTVATQFSALYGRDTCNGTAYSGSALCYLPSSDEDIVGL